MCKEIPGNVKPTELARDAERRGLTVVRHAHRQTFVKSAVLALVAVLLLDFAVVFALVVLQLEPDGPAEETLVGRKVCQNLLANGSVALLFSLVRLQKCTLTGKKWTGTGGSRLTHADSCHTYTQPFDLRSGSTCCRAPSPFQPTRGCHIWGNDLTMFSGRDG